MTLTNEDLLAISQLLDVKLDAKLQAELQPVKDEIRDIKLGMDIFQSQLDRLEVKISSVQLHIENETDKNIQLLAENYVPAAKRYEKASAQIDAMQSDQEIMKKVITDHSRKLQMIG